MVLTMDQIREIAQGVDHVIEENGDIVFRRFTKEQEEFYKGRSEDSYLRAFDPASVKLRFRTDSRTLSIRARMDVGSSRSYFCVDVFVNGERIGTMNNFEDCTLPEMYTLAELPLGEYESTFDLGDGDKEVCVYLPWSVKMFLHSMELDDGATLQAVRPKQTLLAFGDSITQGYDALYPSNMFITRFAEYLDVELYNKAIGGERFAPQLAAMKEKFVPDYITVTYGTNDWNRYTREVFIENCTGFFKNLRETYPTSKIVAVTPIWRRDGIDGRVFGAFTDVDGVIRDCVAECDGIEVISGYEFVPQDSSLYADTRLHPNDEGFACYYNGLVNAWNA